MKLHIPDRSRPAQGFTLMEVMVALAIMSLIATVAFAGLSIGIDSWTRGSRKIDEMDRRAGIERLLKRQLAVAYPMEFRTGEGQRPFIFFRGTENSIEFVADYSLADGPTDFRKIGYRFEAGEFRYEEKQLLGYTPQDDERIEAQTLATFSTVRFGYIVRDLEGNLEWAGEWVLGDGLPAAVRVQIDDDVFIIRMVNTR